MTADKSKQDTSGRMVVEIDIEGYVTYVNEKTCRVLGCTEADIIGKSWFNNFIPEDIRKEMITVFRRLMNNDMEFTEYFENQIITFAGERRLIAWHNRLLKDGEGNNIGTQSFGEDITDH